jgi:hypothetical protein
MPESFCQSCKKSFAYDFDLGLNVKYFQSEATRTCFFGGGDFPCCPECETRCLTEEARNYQSSQIRWETKLVRKRPGGADEPKKLLPDNVSQQKTTD